MIKFFRNIEGKFFNVLTYYIIGPALVLLLLYTLVNDPSEIFDNTPVSRTLSNNIDDGNNRIYLNN